jgi:hypothetical protein
VLAAYSSSLLGPIVAMVTPRTAIIIIIKLLGRLYRLVLAQQLGGEVVWFWHWYPICTAQL